MAKITIHAGDFPKGDAAMHFGQIVLPWGPGDGFTGKTIALADLEEIDVASEENVKRVGGTIGWGAAGALVLGPVGLLAGLLLGGKKTEVTFVAKFKGGRKMLGSTDSKTYKTMMATVFK
jgi:hypothetical protein